MAHLFRTHRRCKIPKDRVMNSTLLRHAVVLGLLTAIGPFAIDMYLPALPSIGENLGADDDLVVMSLTAFFIPFGLFQIVYGPVSDIVGRKAPLYFGIALFAIASIGCALATDIEMLIVFRALQGIGAAAGIVIPGAIVRDLHTGVEAVRLQSLLMLVFGISPILSPLAGSIVIELADWRAIFFIVTVLAGLGLVMLATLLEETRPRAARGESSVGGTLKALRLLLADRNFMALTFIGGFALASFFVYLANSSFILMDHYGLSPMVYSLAFSVNAAAFFGSAQLNGWLGRRFGLDRIVRPAVFGFTAAMAALFALTIAGVDRLDVLAVLLFVGYFFLGQILPITSVLAMEEHGAIAGAASSLMGTLRLVTGAIVIGVSSAFADGTLVPMVAGIAACALLTFVLTQLTLGRSGAAKAEEAPAECR